jgi:nucleoid DNA-binding protein
VAGIKKLAKSAGVSPEAVEDVLSAIVRLARAGERVSLRGFGAFWSQLHPGRTQITPLVPGGAVTYSDRRLLKFKPSLALKQRMNRQPAKGKKKVANGKRQG